MSHPPYLSCRSSRQTRKDLTKTVQTDHSRHRILLAQGAAQERAQAAQPKKDRSQRTDLPLLVRTYFAASAQAAQGLQRNRAPNVVVSLVVVVVVVVVAVVVVAVAVVVVVVVDVVVDLAADVGFVVNSFAVSSFAVGSFVAVRSSVVQRSLGTRTAEVVADFGGRERRSQ